MVNPYRCASCGPPGCEETKKEISATNQLFFFEMLLGIWSIHIAFSLIVLVKQHNWLERPIERNIMSKRRLFNFSQLSES